MNWANEQFWRDLADIGIHPNVPDKKTEIEVGNIYRNRNGKWYLCKSVAGENATMERITDHWTLVAHGIRLYEDGTIEWNYSTGGHWKKEDLDHGAEK